jgi:8-oxo-dGTP pyrophosphatase MutT (NUDIX family)
MEKFTLPDRIQISEEIEQNTFGCVAIIYCRSTGNFVLQNRLGGNDRVTFALPGGKRNPGEKSRDCVVREIKEETGLDIIDVYPFLYRYEYSKETQEEGKPDRRDMVIQYFLAVVSKEEELENQLEDAKEFNPRWYSLSDIQCIADSFLLYNARGMKDAWRALGFHILLKYREQ